jgi:multisubunit Na+/H+ antiporter MnhB subunit
MMSPNKALWSFLPRFPVLLLSLALTLTLGVAVFTLPPAPSRLVDAIHDNMSHTGVTNPITAVLLNFRGYDTLLEIGVLLVAAFGMKALPQPQDIRPGSIPGSGPILQALVRLVVPLMVLTAGYLLWAGSHAPGGAFQGGAILGAAAVLVLLAGMPLSGWLHGRWFRGALIMGFILFLGVGMMGIATGGYFLEYPRDQAGALILLIEAALTVSIGLILATLFLGNPQASHSSTTRKHDP